MDFEFSKTSKKRLRTCHEDLQLIMECAIAFSKVDFGIAEGHRSVERQQELFKQRPRVTWIDGVNKKSKHNHSPSMAVDVYAYVDGKANYEEENMREIARCVKFCAQQLALSGKTSHGVTWGGDWTKFVDMPHYELCNSF